ncbi:pentapeptide repeat-containing protein [Streptomyces sp. NPDC007083]|uniref:pentapeptide repeat-containing protein n=1 Tax=unclassified Streptomyces TaxID=2593676 RepID=UPI0033FD8D13
MDETTPPWDQCGTGADQQDPVGCRGIRVGTYSACLTHLEAEERDAALADLRPGADLDLRGTDLGAPLLNRISAALRPDAGAGPRFGAVSFAGARLAPGADFRSAVFEGDADFSSATFTGYGDFSSSTFTGGADFSSATFAAGAVFSSAAFHGRVHLIDAHFADSVSFRRVSFHSPVQLGPLVCAEAVFLDDAVFQGRADLWFSADRVSCRVVRFEGPAELQLRYASLDLTGAAFQHPCTVTGDLNRSHALRGEDELASRTDPGASVGSLRGVDASMQLLSDMDLSECAFVGTHHLDQLRLEGRWDLGTTPRGVRWQRGVPRWCTRRQVIQEERRWRTLPGRRPARHDWGPPPAFPDAVPGLAALTTTYRQLRKSREDAKDEPGAADFYYGEMEMRRYSRSRRHAERWLLTLYWAVSGYGLRASRAVAWLGVTMLATVLLTMAFGLPDTPAHAYRAASGLTGKRAPELRRPLPDRFTAERAQRAVDVVLGSVVLRSGEPELTRAGSYLNMTARLTEPVLLGLAVLAVRGRIKRG